MTTNVPCAVWVTTMSNDLRASLQQAFVLHHTPYRNSSLILQLFSHDHGRVSVVARGVRAAKSPWRGLVQPFRPLLVSWRGRSDLHTLTDVEAGGRPVELPGRWLFSGYYLNELLLRLLPAGDAHEALYRQYSTALAKLAHLAVATDAHSPEHEILLRLFEKQLLEEAGYGLQLETEADTGHPIDGERRYCYVLEKGPVAGDNEPFGDGIMLSGRTLLALAAGDLSDPQLRKESKQLMRVAVAACLGDRPLHTRRLMQQLWQGA